MNKKKVDDPVTTAGGARDGRFGGSHPGLLKASGKPSKLYCGLVALSYMVFAVTLLFFNKAALSSYHFPNANVITLAQLCCANALLYVMRKAKAISFTDDVALIPRDCMNGRTGFPTIKMFRRLAPLSCAYMVYMLLSMASVRGRGGCPLQQNEASHAPIAIM